MIIIFTLSTRFRIQSATSNLARQDRPVYPTILKTVNAMVRDGLLPFLTVLMRKGTRQTRPGFKLSLPISSLIADNRYVTGASLLNLRNSWPLEAEYACLLGRLDNPYCRRLLRHICVCSTSTEPNYSYAERTLVKISVRDLVIWHY